MYTSFNSRDLFVPPPFMSFAEQQVETNPCHKQLWEWEQNAAAAAITDGCDLNSDHHHHHHHHQQQLLYPTLEFNPSLLPMSSLAFNTINYPHQFPSYVEEPQAALISPELRQGAYMLPGDELALGRFLWLGREGYALGHRPPPQCQADDCAADLSRGKHYHRRHKVCEYHSKASVTLIAGVQQRFCQQCSRFHALSEFDGAKRSCRKRLADHNRRRRKPKNANVENKIVPADAKPIKNENSINRTTEKQADEVHDKVADDHYQITRYNKGSSLSLALVEEMSWHSPAELDQESMPAASFASSGGPVFSETSNFIPPCSGSGEATSLHFLAQHHNSLLQLGPSMFELDFI